MKKKADYQKMLLKMIRPLTRHYTDDGSGLYLGAFSAGYGNRIAEMEGFSRVLWGLASYWAGGGDDESLLSVYQKGLAAGTDPEAASYWGDLHNKDQRMVEMAAISYGILLVPEKLWEPLSEASKDHLADWLYQINLYSQADNNWHYFKVIVNLALKSVGKKWNPEEVKKAMDRYESFYLGNGWYSDGNGLRRIIMCPLAFIFTVCCMHGLWKRKIRSIRLFLRNAQRHFQRALSTGLMMRERPCPLAVL